MERDISPECFFCRNTLSSSDKDPIQDLIQIYSQDVAEIQISPHQKGGRRALGHVILSGVWHTDNHQETISRHGMWEIWYGP
jgi:hypothetical protein